MAKRRVGATVLAWVALALAGASTGAGAFEEGDYFTTFMGGTADGTKVELAAFRDQSAIVVEFWATWSRPSMRQHEFLQKAFDAKRAEWTKAGILSPEVVWVSVSLDRNPADARPHMPTGSPGVINVCDGESFEGPWPRAFGVKLAPALYIIGKEGLVNVVNNNAMEQPGEAVSALNAALVKRAVPRDKLPGNLLFAAERPAVAKVNEPAPAFEVMPINQDVKEPITNETYLGEKVLLIVIFASWHSESVAYVEKASKEILLKYRPHGFEMLAVSIEDDPDKLKKDLAGKKGFLDVFPIVCEPPSSPASMTHQGYIKSPGANMTKCYLIGKNGVVRDIGGELKMERIKQVIVEDLNVNF